MENRFYISTPIYYVNAEPHLGHAYTTIVADVMARFHKLMGDETFFVTGTDEHGDKVLEAARKNGTEPVEYVDRMSDSFRSLWPHLNCAYDRFIRTTDPQHVRVVQIILQRVYDRGDIYFGSYKGLYCMGCERFYAERELEDGLCPQHRVAPEPREEDNYFFRMGRYQEWLVRHLKENPEFIRPERYRNEVLSMLREPLEDLCISRPRSRLAWGIPLPFDNDFVTYVWFDALINYITALDYPDGEAFRRFWPFAQHLIAKDILKPHGIYWPIMLRAAGIQPYRHLNVHGYWNVDASKMSKSLGNIVRPLELVDKYGLDALRYFLLREMVFGLDASFSEVALVQRLNADLANDLGNLLHRSLTMARRYLQGRVPVPGRPEGPDLDLQERALEVVRIYPSEMERLNFHKALMALWEVIGDANRYVDRMEPFRLAKDPARRERLQTILYQLLEVNRLISVMLWPFMPGTAEEICRQLGTRAPDQPGDMARLGRWGVLEAGMGLGTPRPLFPRVDLEEKGLSAAAAGEGKVEKRSEKGEVTIEDFQRLDLRVGRVTAAEAVKGSHRLMRVVVDIAGEERQLVAGVGEKYGPGDLVGKSVVVLTNLKPARILGQLSQGMLLAAVHGDDLRLVTLDGEIASGAQVR